MSMETTHEQKPDNPIKSSNTRGVWFNRIALAFIIGTFPILYFLGYINKEWINRIGIILNFLAGFMVAPELIGVERLAKIENYMEELFASRKTWLESNHSLITNYFNDETIDDDQKFNKTLAVISLSSLATIIAITILIWIRQYLLSFFALGVYYFLVFALITHFFSEETYRKFRASFSKSIKKYFSWRIFSSIAFIALLSVYLPFWYIAVKSLIVILALFQKPMTFVLSKLSGDEQLRYILVRWGILLFVLGNLFQFIATF